jgi:hypothetical protein
MRRWHVGRWQFSIQNEICLLIVVRVTVAPVPVVLLVAVLPVLVRNIRVVAVLLVVPVGAVFTVIPIVVVVVMRVVNANLDVLFLRRRRGRHGTANCQSCRQEQPA